MIYRIQYNWFYCVQFGEVFQDFTVGSDYTDPVSGELKTCTSIEYHPSGRLGHAIIHFSDGTFQMQDNLNAVLIREEDGVQAENK